MTAKKSLLSAVVLYVKVVCSCKMVCRARKCSLEEPLLFAYRAHGLTELPGNSWTQVCGAVGIGRSGNTCVSHLVRAVAALSSEVLHMFHVWIHMPRQASSCFPEPLGSVSTSTGLTVTSSGAAHQFFVDVWLILHYLPCTSPLFNLSALRNSYCWTQETFIRDTTANLPQSTAGFL